MRTLGLCRLPLGKGPLVPDIEKAIMKSDLGLNPSTAGTVIRIPLPALTEETRKTYGKQAKAEAENARVSIRNIRRDILSVVKDLLKEKDISEDEERKANDDIQKITDRFVGRIDESLVAKEKDLDGDLISLSDHTKWTKI